MKTFAIILKPGILKGHWTGIEYNLFYCLSVFKTKQILLVIKNLNI